MAGSVDVTQLAVEVVITGSPTITTPTANFAAVSQLAVEVVQVDAAAVNVSQLAVEVVQIDGDSPSDPSAEGTGPSSYPVWLD